MISKTNMIANVQIAVNKTINKNNLYGLIVNQWSTEANK